LSTFPQEYLPYPGGENDDDGVPRGKLEAEKCIDCSVHAGFMTSWRRTRRYTIPYLEELIKIYPDYQLTLVGHSLGGAVAALASLEFHARGWAPQVTTFGEPRIGNFELTQYIDRVFAPDLKLNATNMYRRVTHVDDPVPLLPPSEWGYEMHAGEVYISKKNLPPAAADIRHCQGDQDPKCIAGPMASVANQAIHQANEEIDDMEYLNGSGEGVLVGSNRIRIWELFLAHRDYFWRLGLCLPDGHLTKGFENIRMPEEDVLRLTERSPRQK
jgi:hypothetical protein